MIFIPRFTLVFIWGIFSFLVGIIIGIFRPFHPSNVRACGRILCPLGFKILGIDFDLRGQGNFKKQMPFVIVANHQNNFDMFPGGYTIPNRCVTLGKSSIVWIPIFGLFYWLSGNILIDRSNKRKAKASMERVTREILENNKSIYIMPEGTRGRGREILLPFKRGAFLTAINAQVPIIPVCYSSYHNRMKWNKLKSGKIIGKILEPIPTAGMKPEDSVALMERVYQLMKNQIIELNKEIEQG
ncbi:MAG: 1-acyl-sn-glycerol-3-phosphate acyltransferase [Halobacteriovorax sp.]|nr:1-acyl-sn-glycerol-3-phosphate acyltransferase [Halobacteriovorax sp.]